MRSISSLSNEQTQHFLERGHVVLRDCFPRAFAEQWRKRAWVRLGYDPQDPATWKRARVHLAGLDMMRVPDFAPKAWAAMLDLVGGEERIRDPQDQYWPDGFIINFHVRADQPWLPPSSDAPGWHKDGEFFRHFLDSPEQGLLVIVLWSDILPRSGGTFIACDSVKHVAELLLEHPEGLPPTTNFGQLVEKCSDFEEMTGRAGDVVLMHPYMLHAASANPSGRPRFITNPLIPLREPMCFNRPDADYSLIEQAVLHQLGVDNIEFEPLGEREFVKAEGAVARSANLQQEKERLRSAGFA
jgi:hypothetical protein